jgi:adenosylhomocysteine nucleosidase
MSLKIGMVVALPIEARMLTRETLAFRTTISIKENILLHIGGMGGQAAEAASQDLLRHGATGLISWGTAGGLSPALAAGTLVLADRILSKRQEVFETDKIWRDHLRTHLAHLAPQCGALVQAEQAITSVAAKAQLFSEYQAVAVDMESAAVAAVAKQAGAPFLAIRSIVDAADFALPEWLSVCLDSAGAVRINSLLKFLCRHPRQLPALVHLAQSFAAAQASLRSAAEFLGSAKYHHPSFPLPEVLAVHSSALRPEILTVPSPVSLPEALAVSSSMSFPEALTVPSPSQGEG